MPAAMTLLRTLAQRAGLSRREATRYILQGRVEVDGQICLDPARPVSEDAALVLDDRPLQRPPRMALLHKPIGVHSTVGDPQGRPSLEGMARELLEMGLHPVGRLDADTDGLLLFSGDGALTQRLLHPRRAIPRTYRATVEPSPDPSLSERLASGVRTADGVFCAQVLALQGDTVTLTVTEGKHRMVRRMLANAGHPVLALRRLQFGPFVLGDLAPGQWRPATPEELSALDQGTSRASTSE
jgi:23S rRNA pseudouridine2605 synthase